MPASLTEGYCLRHGSIAARNARSRSVRSGGSAHPAARRANVATRTQSMNGHNNRMLKTTITGSLPKPAWLAEPQKLWPAWRATGQQPEEAKRDAKLPLTKSQ